jgi:hypothetical protein
MRSFQISHFTVLMTLLLGCSISRNHEALIMHHVSFAALTTRMDLAISDLCSMLNLVNLHDPDHPMVIDLTLLGGFFPLKIDLSHLLDLSFHQTASNVAPSGHDHIL